MWRGDSIQCTGTDVLESLLYEGLLSVVTECEINIEIITLNVYSQRCSLIYFSTANKERRLISDH